MIKIKLFQLAIPDKLSMHRYISSFAALNLRPPEGTSGDWHFTNIFYSFDPKPKTVYIAGEGERLNTNSILGEYGIYNCTQELKLRGLVAQGVQSWAANHFRAILDLVYKEIHSNHVPKMLYWACEDYLDTKDEKLRLLQKASEMLPLLNEREQKLLMDWINHEHQDGYRS